MLFFLRASKTSESYLEGKDCICRKISESIDNVHYKMDNFDSNFDKCLLRGWHKMWWDHNSWTCKNEATLFFVHLEFYRFQMAFLVILYVFHKSGLHWNRTGWCSFVGVFNFRGRINRRRPDNKRSAMEHWRW